MVDSLWLLSVLPTVKCSKCTQDIPISMMGEHVCGSRFEPTPPPDAVSNIFDSVPTTHSQQNTQSQFENMTGRMAPPRADTSAANEAFLSYEEWTPVSASSDPLSSSPPALYDGRTNPLGNPPRGARGAIRTPSPEILSSNNESAFPPFPPPNSGSSNIKGRHDNKANRTYAPKSPRDGNFEGLLQRMNTIKPGPFDVSSTQKSRPGTSGSQGEGVHVDGRRKISDVENEGCIPQSSSNPAILLASIRTTSPEKKTIGKMPKLDRTAGYRGFGPPNVKEDESLQWSRPETKRSMTFPMDGTNASNSIPRRPSAPSSTSSPRRVSDGSEVSKNDYRRTERGSPSRQGRRASEDRIRPPPRGDSLRTRTNAITTVNLAAEFGCRNPYHSPSESVSSVASSTTAMSAASSRSSPPGSIETTNSPRKPADTTALGGIMSEIQSKLVNALPKESSNVAPQTQMQYAVAKPLRGLDPSLLSPESPMDPAIRDGRLSPIKTYAPSEAQAKKIPPAPRSPKRRPSTAKGDCKACGEPIKGKSISSADGRLTGRYHKQCFTCKTCCEPFATSEFYVIDDAPYCEHHYHHLNNSLCNVCDKGIEGQYLETENKQKYHSKCLTCSDCRRVLRDEYFEMNGLVYCERDAHRKAQQRNFLAPGAGANRMERRTTRMMMMTMI